MRRIINSTYITVDGAIEEPERWPSNGVEDGSYEIQTALLFDCDALIMGRRTYDAFAAVWPTRSGDEYSDRINVMSKYVVSTTMDKPDWTNTKVISDDVVESIRRLRDEPGQNILQYGFGRLSYTLMEHGLLDELRLWVHPFFIGSGGQDDLLYRESQFTRLSLLEAQPLKSGVVILTYQFQ